MLVRKKRLAGSSCIDGSQRKLPEQKCGACSLVAHHRAAAIAGLRAKIGQARKEERIWSILQPSTRSLVFAFGRMRPLQLGVAHITYPINQPNDRATKRPKKNAKERRTRDSNPQPVTRQHSSNVPASHSLILQERTIVLHGLQPSRWIAIFAGCCRLLRTPRWWPG